MILYRVLVLGIWNLIGYRWSIRGGYKPSSRTYSMTHAASTRMSELHALVQLRPNSTTAVESFHLARCCCEENHTLFDTIETFRALQYTASGGTASVFCHDTTGLPKFR